MYRKLVVNEYLWEKIECIPQLFVFVPEHGPVCGETFRLNGESVSLYWEGV